MKKILNTFIMLLICIMIVPITAKAETVSDKFTDIPADTWYTSSVQYVYDQGYMSGKSATWFDAAGTLTRAEFVTTLYSIAGKPEVNDVENQFTDVANDWYTNSVLWASSTGCVSGYGDGRFGVNDNITREQLALILYKNGKDAAPEIDEEILNGFHDTASISSYATEALKWAVTNGIMSGTADGNLNPQGNATRAECAVMLCKYCGLLDSQQINYAINGLTVDGTKVTVTVTTQDACTLSVAILNEDDETVLITGEVDVAEGLEMGTATVTLPDTPPEYFLAQAVLRDGDGNAVSNTYTSLQYTSAYEEFIAQTPEDFPDNVVQDFGESGFGVMVDHAIVVESLATASGENEYTFAAAEAPQVGDVLLLSESDSVQVPVKVKAVTDNGDGTVTVIKDEDASFSDFYQVLKLDAVIDVGAVAQQGQPEVLLANNDDEVEFKLLELNEDLEVGAFSIKADLTVRLDVKVTYDERKFGDYFEYENYVSVEGSANAILKGSIGSEELEDALGNPIELVLFKGPVTIKNAGLAEVQLAVTIPLEFEVEGSGTVGFTVSSKTGFSFNPRDGMQPIRKNEITPKFELKAGFTIKTGPKISLSGVIAEDTLKATVSCQCGIKAEGEIKKELDTESERKEFHACDLCCKMTLTAFFVANGELKYEFNEDIKGTLLSVDLLSGDVELGEAYCSILNEEESIYGGQIAFGFGNCLNYKYLVTVTTQDKFGDKVTDIPVKVTADGNEKGSGASPYKLYLYDGVYRASADFDSGTFEHSFTVDRGPQEVLVSEKETMIRGTVTAAATGQAIEGARVTLSLPDGTTRASVTNDAGGYAISGIVPGSYDMEITADSYQPWTKSEVTIEPGLSNNQDAQLKPEYYTVSFAANGGSGTMSPVKVWYDEALTLPECAFTAPEGKIFKAWSVGASEYKAGEEYSPVTADMTASAVWKEDNGEVSVTVTVLNPDGSVASGVAIEGTGLSTAPVTGDDGSVTFDVAKGSYTFSASASDYYASETVEVDGETQVTLTLAEAYMEWSLSGGVLTIQGNGPMPDYEQYKAPWYSNRNDIEKVVVDGVTTIGSYAFWNCRELRDVIISNNVTVIGDGAFFDCIKLGSVTLPYSVTIVGTGAFGSCIELANVALPNSVTTIGAGAFSSCKSLVGVVIPNGVTTIGSNAFGNCESLQSVVLPNSLTTIPYGTFSSCESLTSVIIPNSVISIGNYAFAGCTSLGNLTLPDSVTTIGVEAFRNCESLVNVTIPDSVTTIENAAFAYCKSMRSVTLPNSVTTIGDAAFRNCENLVNVALPNSVDTINHLVFAYCSNLSSVTIPDSVITIGNRAFYECTSLSNVTIPSSVTSIHQGAFYGCTNLRSVSMPDSVTFLGDQTFYNCESLSNVRLSNSITVIKDYTFFGCKSLSSVTIPNGVTQIGSYAFCKCSALNSMTLPEGVTYIGAHAYSNCSNLKSIRIPDSVTRIGFTAFGGCESLAKVTLPVNITTISEYTFRGCSNLSSVTIPVGITTIEDYAFDRCESLTTIYYNGTQSQWNAIEIGSYNEPLEAIAITTQ